MAQTKAPFDRVIWVVLDGVGAGALPDAPQYADQGSDTLGNLSRALPGERGKPLTLPNLQTMGLGNLTSIEHVPALAPGQGKGAYGRARERSAGKDTTSGHWEMAGLVVSQAFPVFENGFPREWVDQWVRDNHLPGVLGNKPASGTVILEELGAEHMATGKPILYTSADSVWQVAAHEGTFGLDRLYEICESARELCDRHQIGRVIARPFIGDPSKGQPFKRTYNRKDYSIEPPQDSYLDHLVKEGVHTLGIGKITNIYADRGIQENIHTEGNTDGIRVLLEQIGSRGPGLMYCNLIDFDMLWGHRRDVRGFAGGLEDFDAALPALQKKMGPRDLLVLAADHGNDPTFRGSDHTREHIPVIVWSPSFSKGAAPLGDLDTFADVGATVFHALTGEADPGKGRGLAGKSFLPQLQKLQSRAS
ncbi:MAG TPA: phosphopentomutase [Bdellovibrionota bacterium]|jgi:phosphopentomutase|nr:phosphopentomutase [Bdellovibrionota bacterium]